MDKYTGLIPYTPPAISKYPALGVYNGQMIDASQINALAACINDLNERMIAIEEAIGLAMED